MSEFPEYKEVVISDEAVRKATGKEWKEWFAILDAASAHKMTHKEIVSFLTDKYIAGSWWRQMITVQYELKRGLRLKHQKPDGYQISRSKTINAPVAKLFNTWHNKLNRSKWLKDPEINITTSNKNRSIRAKWIDKATTIEVNFYEKGGDKTQVVIQHNKLKSPAAAEKMKTYWSNALDNLKNYF